MNNFSNNIYLIPPYLVNLEVIGVTHMSLFYG